MCNLPLLTFYFFTFLLVNSSDDFDSDDDADNEQLRNAFNKISLQPALIGPTTVDARDLKDPNTPFEKVHDDVFCNDGPPAFQLPLATAFVANMRECKEQCWKDYKCIYMAFWVKTKKCQTYTSCYSQIADGTNRISVYKRVSPCESKLKDYTTRIASQFDQDILRPMYIPFEWQKNEAPNSVYAPQQQPNFYCRCTGLVWMTCGLFVYNTTAEFQILNDKFDPEDTANLAPFISAEGRLFKYGGESRYITYSDGELYPRVTAEIHPTEWTMHETMSLPGCVHIEQCIKGTPGGVCPVLKTPFQSGEPVYILKRDILYGRGANRKTLCISVKGLRSYILNAEPIGTFKDPLGRINFMRLDDEDHSVLLRRQQLTLMEDYGMFFMFDDSAMATGICGPNPPRPPPDIPSPDIQMPPTASKSGGSEAGPSSFGSGDGEDKPKKTRRGKKKKKERSSVSSDASSPVMGEPGSLPLMPDEGAQEEAPPISRTVSDTALVSMNAGAMSSPDSGNEPGPTSPFSFSDLEVPSTPGGKQKIVLTPREVAQLRRSFEAAKARRAGFKHARDERQEPPARISASKTSEFGLLSDTNEVFHSRFWVSTILLLLLLLSCSCFHSHLTNQQNADKDYLLLEDEI